MKKQLTDRQEDILNFIYQFLEENGYPPTLREIGKKFDISSTFGVKRHLDALEKKGHLTVENNASRGISLIRDEEFADVTPKSSYMKENLFNKIPIVGRVAAGSPILAEENIEGSIVIDQNFLKKSEDSFALKVKGDSMINAGIFEDDLVIVSPQTSAKRGEIIVARVDDEITVKRFELTGNTVRLLPENENYTPIEITPENDFNIVGKVSGVIRWFN